MYLTLREEGYTLTDLHTLMVPRPFLVSSGTKHPPELWNALNHSIRANGQLGHTNRVVRTSRPEHSPDAKSVRDMVAFFFHFLRP